MDEDQARILVWRYIRQIGTCMMVTRESGAVRARPMRGMAREASNIIWFLADRDDNRNQEGEACLTYADMREQTFVAVTGMIELVDNPAMVEELSNPATEAYFPGGPHSPEIQLLKFAPDFGEYWDAPSSPILLAIKFLQAKVSGERPDLGVTGAARLGP